MSSPEKDRLAAEAIQCWVDFQERLSSVQQKYPVQEFRAFWAVTKRYAELTRSDPLIHRSVVGAVNGLADFLEVERKRVPGDILRDAERLECLLFSGYDPHFEGDEPGDEPRDCNVGRSAMHFCACSHGPENDVWADFPEADFWTRIAF